MHTEIMLSLEQVRQCLGISRATCARRLKDKSEPFCFAVRLKKRVLIPQSKFNLWARSSAAAYEEKDDE